MIGPGPAHAVPSGGAGIPFARPLIDLRLDGNQGRAPTPDFLARLELDPEWLRCYPLDRSLEQALAARHGVEPDRIFVGAGADDVLDRLCRAVLEPGRTAIVPEPTFEMLPRYVALAGAERIAVPWPAGPWPLPAVLAAVTERTALVAIVSPNNPTGLVASAADVEAVLAAAPRAIALVDAAYAEFADEDLTALAARHDRVVAVRTFSKAFGLAGMRIGYAVAAPPVVGWLGRVGSPFTAGTLARRAALRRLDDAPGEVRDYIAAVARERGQLAVHCASLGLDPLPSQANFVFVRGADPEWIVDALAGLGIAVRAIAGGVRITLPGEPAAFARVTAALSSAVRPEALLFDLDGVLIDLDRRQPLAARADLEALSAHLPLGVVTNCPRRLAVAVLERHRLAPFVRALVAAEDGPAKPDPAPVRLALERLGAARAWLCGDNPGDVAAARAAGVVPLAVAPAGIGAAAHAARLVAAGAARLVAGAGGVRALWERIAAQRSCR